MKERLRRMNHLLQREISRILLEDMGDPRCKLITVLEVRMSKDLKIATVYCSVMDKKEEKEKTFHALERAKGYIQHRVAQNVKLRFTPLIRFVLDESIDESIRINELLKKAEINNANNDQDLKNSGAE